MVSMDSAGKFIILHLRHEERNENEESVMSALLCRLPALTFFAVSGRTQSRVVIYQEGS